MLQQLAIGFAAGVIIPGATAWIGARLGPARSGAVAILAFVAGYGVAYWLLPNHEHWIPERHWHWSPYLVAVFAGLGLAGAGDSAGLRRILAFALGAPLAGLLLIPDWPALQPVRERWVLCLAAAAFLFCAANDFVARRAPPRLWSAVAAGTALVTAGLIAAEVSLKYATLAAAAGAALLGCLLAQWFAKDKLDLAPLAGAYVVAVGGTAFLAAIEPSPRIWWLPAVALAPLLLVVWPRRAV